MDWFKIGKGVCQGFILSLCLFNSYAEYIMRNAGLDEAQAGIKISQRNINNLRYADDTTLMAESEEELKSLLMKVKGQSEKAGLNFNIQKTKIMASSPISSVQFSHSAAVAAKSLQSCLTLQPHRRQPTRLLCPWDSPGKNTGVGCHFLLQCMKVKSESEVSQSCQTLSDPMDCSLPGSSVHGIFQARVLEWGAIAFSGAQSCPTLCNPMNRSTPGLPVHHQFPEFTQTHVYRVSLMPSSHLILSSPSPPASKPSQHQGLLQ